MGIVAESELKSTASEVQNQIGLLENILVNIGRAVIAVSGGIDSTLLAVIAGRTAGFEVEMFHAVSPAVPQRATQRVRQFAEAENWLLTVADTGEFRDERYLLNPINRCYHCKTKLYSYMSHHTASQILSGTNMDDLYDFRPGLKAATRHSVRHPYVEAKINKFSVRQLAYHLNLVELAKLPASPCLSSRVQTGTPIDANHLQVIDQVEVAVQQELKVSVVRCRITKDGVIIELDREAFNRLNVADRDSIANLVVQYFSDAFSRSDVAFAPYRRGSAFVVMEE